MSKSEYPKKAELRVSLKAFHDLYILLGKLEEQNMKCLDIIMGLAFKLECQEKLDLATKEHLKKAYEMLDSMNYLYRKGDSHE